MTQTAYRETWAIKVFWIWVKTDGSSGLFFRAAANNSEFFHFYAIFKSNRIDFSMAFNFDFNALRKGIHDRNPYAM